MDKFTKLTGVAAPLPMINVDTDKILPAVYLKTIKRTGLGKVLFDEIRYRPDGSENPDFVLNQAPYRRACILVAGDNFGCGSSREHAPWALLDFGISCVIAPSFADIFYNNCFKNGLLPIVLERQTISRPDGEQVSFEIEPFRKHCLMNGLDDIGLTQQKAGAIRSYEEKSRLSQPWLWGITRVSA